MMHFLDAALAALIIVIAYRIITDRDWRKIFERFF